MMRMIRPDDESLQNSNKILKSSLLILSTSPHTLPSSSSSLFSRLSAASTMTTTKKRDTTASATTLLLALLVCLVCTQLPGAHAFTSAGIGRASSMAAKPSVQLSSSLMHSLPTSTLSFLESFNDQLNIDSSTAEAIAGPFFGTSLFPYLAFLYFLNVEENSTPKGVTVGFACCLLFVFLSIPAAIAAKVLYGVSLADSDWLHGSAESMLTVTNLITCVAFRQALNAKERAISSGEPAASAAMPKSALDYQPMVILTAILTVLAGITALVPAINDPTVHTPYLGGFMDIPADFVSNIGWGIQPEPENALTVACWIIHVSSLIEFLVAMGFCWRWADVVGNSRWKGLTWGLLPLHSSGITACVYHFFFNQIAILVPLQALLTCIGNTTAAIAAYRIAVSNGWTADWADRFTGFLNPFQDDEAERMALAATRDKTSREESPSLVGFEDLGDALAGDNDYTFLLKLFAGSAAASYALKYGELWFPQPFEANVYLGLAFIFIPSMLNAYKWNRRSQDPDFEGWF